METHNLGTGLSTGSGWSCIFSEGTGSEFDGSPGSVLLLDHQVVAISVQLRLVYQRCPYVS